MHILISFFLRCLISHIPKPGFLGFRGGTQFVDYASQAEHHDSTIYFSDEILKNKQHVIFHVHTNKNTNVANKYTFQYEIEIAQLGKDAKP